LAAGWTIVSVVGTPPVRLFQNRAGRLWQEAFSVFLEHQVTDEDRIDTPEIMGDWEP